MRSFSALSVTLIGSTIALAAACSSDSTTGGTGGSGATASGGASSGGAASGGAATGGAATGGAATGGSVEGVAGSGGSGTGGATATCEKPEVSFPAADAGLSVGGFGYLYMDEAGSCIDDATNPVPAQLCLKGTGAQVVDMMWSAIWGAGLGIQLAGDGSPKVAFDASAYEGFSFAISGTFPGLRVGVLQMSDANNSFFTTDIAEGPNTIAFADLAQGDWVDPPGTLDLATLTDIQFQIPTVASGDVPFDFCVSDVEFVTDAGMGGAGGMGGAN